jgi:hypothetical protein
MMKNLWRIFLGQAAAPHAFEKYCGIYTAADSVLIVSGRWTSEGFFGFGDPAFMVRFEHSSELLAEHVLACLGASACVESSTVLEYSVQKCLERFGIRGRDELERQFGYVAVHQIGSSDLVRLMPMRRAAAGGYWCKSGDPITECSMAVDRLGPALSSLLREVGSR